jgi:CO/xanthine dehydrogenase FAD-binding subunit
VTAYTRPATLAEAYAARAAHPDHVVLAGGTDLLVGSHHRPEPAGIIDVGGLADLSGVSVDGDAVAIKAGTTYAELLKSDVIQEQLPALWECAREVGAVQIQERGTLGGNMATSSPVGDTLPVLLALDAEVELGSTRGTRRVPYHGFCTGYRKIDLAADELIVAVHVPKPAAGTVQYWRKVGTRRAQAISKVMVAGAARLEGGKLSGVRLAMGAVADRPVRLLDVEALLEGQAPSAALAEQVAAKVREVVVPITDVRSTKEYRLGVAARLAARFVRELEASA